MVLGKKVAIFDWECGRNSAPREGQKIPCHFSQPMAERLNHYVSSRANHNIRAINRSAVIKCCIIV